MSRIGKMPINLPAGVTVTIEDGNQVSVKGPKGTLSQAIPTRINIVNEDGVLTLERSSESKEDKALHGLSRTLVFNMVQGVTEGYKKQLEINGVGYRAAKQGDQLVLNLGYSHNVIVDEPEGITIEVPQPNTIIVTGADKQKVGQIAAEIRKKRPPEPYLGKGIKYSDEKIRRKTGKAGG